MNKLATFALILAAVLAALLTLPALTGLAAPPIDEPKPGRSFYDGMPLENRAPGVAPAAPEVSQTPLVDIPPSHTRIVFQSYRDNNWEIYLSYGDGFNPVRLTTNNVGDLEPSLNRGSTRVVYTTNDGTDYELAVMNADGTQRALLTNNDKDDIYPAWSPDGTRFAFQSYRDGQAEIYVMNTDGSAPTRLTTDADYDGMPAWSPDSSQILFVSRRTGGYRIYRMNADGSAQTMLSDQRYSADPAWSPDGQKIAYDADDDNDGFQELWTMDADGTNQSMVYDHPYKPRDILVRSWSPDGQYVAYTLVSWINNNGEWYWTDAYLQSCNSKIWGGGNTLNSTGNDWNPDWKPLDYQFPSSSINALPAQSPGPFTVNWTGSDSGLAGLKGFNIQVKEGAEGTWVDWKNLTADTSAVYPGVGGHTYFFRSRAIDQVWNVEPWAAASDTWTTVELYPPETAVEPLPAYSHNSATIRWGGKDPGDSGIQTYDVQVRDGATAAWIDWKIGVSDTSAVYPGEITHKYFFRTRARDRAQNLEPWPPGDGDTFTTPYTTLIAGTITDNRGSPVSGAVLQVNPDPIASLPSDLSGTYAAFMNGGSNYSYFIRHDSYGTLPSSNTGIFDASGAVAIDFALPPKDDVIQGGNFESVRLEGWQASGAFSASATTISHTGASSALVGPAITNIKPGNLRVLLPGAALDTQGALHILSRHGNEIYYNHRDPSGSWSESEYIATGLDQMAAYNVAHMAVSASGIAHVIWIQKDLNGLKGYFVVYARRDLSGVWSSPAPVSGIDRVADYAAIGLDGSGNAHVVWRERNYGQATTRFMAAQQEANGAWSTPVEISTTTRSKVDAAIAVQADGSAHVLWREYIEDAVKGRLEFLYYARRNAGGGWAAPELVKTGDNKLYHQYTPQVRLDGQGALHAIWLWDDGMDIYYARRSSAGVWSTPENISNSTATRSDNPDFIVQPDGAVSVVWEETVQSYHTKVYYARRSIPGVWSRPEFVSEPDDYLYSPHISIDSRGAPLVTWSKDSSLYLSRKSASGAWSPGSLIHSRGYNAQVFFGPDNEIQVVWQYVWFGLNTIYHTTLYNQPTQTLFSQTVAIPTTMVNPTLSFYYKLEGSTRKLGDNLRVSIREGGTSTTVFSSSGITSNWTHAWADLSRWAGKQVQINFEVVTDQYSPVVWIWLDEVTLGSSYPDLWLNIPQQANGLPGAQVQVQLHYGNQSGASAKDVTITQTLPDSLELISADPAPSENTTGILTWKLGDLAPSQVTGTITLTLGVLPSAAPNSRLTSAIQIAGSLPEPETTDNRFELEVWVGEHIYLPVVANNYFY